jgi:hypothetical protein
MAKTASKNPPRYAEGTKVSVEKSHLEVQKLLKRYGATNTGYGEQQNAASILFTMRGRQYRMELPYPDLSQFQYAPRHVRRTSLQMQQAREQEMRRLWRALVMVVKAKLEAVQSGIVTFEQEFLAYTVLDDNQTVGQWIEPQIAGGRVLLLPESRSARPDEIPDIIIE